MFNSIVGALVAPTPTERHDDGFVRSSTVRFTYNPITRRFRLVRILTIEGKVMNKVKEEKDVLTPAPEWVQDELPLSLS